jgi:hypothetical protein
VEVVLPVWFRRKRLDDEVATSFVPSVLLELQHVWHMSNVDD